MQEEFQKYANRFKRKWFGPERVKGLLPEDIEAEFWRTVEQSKQPVEVLYGSDLDASIYGEPQTSDGCLSRCFYLRTGPIVPTPCDVNGVCGQ